MIQILSFYGFALEKLKPCRSVPTWTLRWWRSIVQVPCAPFASDWVISKFSICSSLLKNFPRASHLQALGKNKLKIGDEPCIGSIASQHKNSDQMRFTSFWPTAGQLDHMIFLPYILWQHWEALASEAPIPQVLPATTPDRCTEIWDDAWATNWMKLRSFIFNSARPLFTASVPEQR